MKPRRAAALALLIAFASMPFVFVVAAEAREGAACKSSSGSVSHSGIDGSSCDANSDGSSAAHAVATDNSYASSAVLTGGGASAVAKGNSISTSTANSGGHSTSRASNSGGATTYAQDRGVAKATASGGAIAESGADARCKTMAHANGTTGTRAFALCNKNGGFVNATATNGGVATGSDTDPPICTPNGGSARVRSTGGNCGSFVK
jgi:hypothetical protein